MATGQSLDWKINEWNDLKFFIFFFITIQVDFRALLKVLELLRKVSYKLIIIVYVTLINYYTRNEKSLPCQNIYNWDNVRLALIFIKCRPIREFIKEFYIVKVIVLKMLIISKFYLTPWWVWSVWIIHALCPSAHKRMTYPNKKGMHHNKE